MKKENSSSNKNLFLLMDFVIIVVVMLFLFKNLTGPGIFKKRNAKAEKTVATQTSTGENRNLQPPANSNTYEFFLDSKMELQGYVFFSPDDPAQANNWEKIGCKATDSICQTLTRAFNMGHKVKVKFGSPPLHFGNESAGRVIEAEILFGTSKNQESAGVE
jgi:hypothetical protein